MSDYRNTHQLIADIEQKDRRFRLAQSIFMTVVMLTLIGVVIAQLQTLSAVQTQLDNEAIATQEARTQRDNQLRAIERRLNCMVVFFSVPEREGLSIKNIETCALNQDESIDKFFLNEELNNLENPPNLAE